ncbi:MAG: OmpA family protein [Pseudomonadota bacterium]
MPNSILKSYLIQMASVTAILSGCASTPERLAILDEAQAAYATASANPQVNQYAPLELRKAGQALEQAQRLQSNGADRDEIAHYAYLAKRNTEIAQQTTQSKAAQQVVANAGEQRNRLLLSARTREADLAKQQAQQQANQARQAQQQSSVSEEQAAKAQQRARELEQKLSDLNAKHTSRGVILTLPDVLFDVGEATLKPGAYQAIDRLATVMKDDPAVAVRVEGFTDSTGSDRLNRELSQRRAESIRTALVDRGIQENRIDARGFGESLPVATNATAIGRQANRRVDIVVMTNRNEKASGSSIQ